jgi:hypothetical protein
LFNKDTDTIGLHLRNIFKEKELEEKLTTEDLSVVQTEGNRQVRRTVKFYNLDAVISVGYRVNSKQGTQFRQWATQRLKDYLVQGYAIEEKAASLLYLIIKNHGFVDGNKRIAAACFLLFLERNQLLYNQSGRPIVSNEALAGLTLFVASSKPEEMNTVKKLVISLLNRNQ